MTRNELSGCVAVVTGSARNIGRSIALELATAGAAVIVNARHSERAAEAVVAEIRSGGGRAELKLADVSSPEGAAALIAAAVDHFGRLDILVNNASVRRETDFARLEYQEWREILAVTLDGAFLCTRAALPQLIASGRGAVVNIGGLSAHTGAARRAHVVAAKAGLAGLTRALAHDLAPNAITVNCVAPGVIDTVRDRGSTRGCARTSRRPHAADWATWTARRGRGGRAVPVRSGCPLHHRADDSRQRWNVHGLTTGARPGRALRRASASGRSLSLSFLRPQIPPVQGNSSRRSRHGMNGSPACRIDMHGSVRPRSSVFVATKRHEDRRIIVGYRMADAVWLPAPAVSC